MDFPREPIGMVVITCCQTRVPTPNNIHLNTNALIMLFLALPRTGKAIGLELWLLEATIPRQSLKVFTFCVKLSDSTFFLFYLSPIVKLI
jgi:hypothetical protein